MDFTKLQRLTVNTPGTPWPTGLAPRTVQRYQLNPDPNTKGLPQYQYRANAAAARLHPEPSTVKATSPKSFTGLGFPQIVSTYRKSEIADQR